MIRQAKLFHSVRSYERGVWNKSSSKVTSRALVMFFWYGCLFHEHLKVCDSHEIVQYYFHTFHMGKYTLFTLN